MGWGRRNTVRPSIRPSVPALLTNQPVGADRGACSTGNAPVRPRDPRMPSVYCELEAQRSDHPTPTPTWSRTAPQHIDELPVATSSMVGDNSAMGIRDETMWLDATAQGELVKTGEVSAVELVDAAIERIEELNPSLNAVIHPLFDKAHAVVASGLQDGPFQGVPLVLKDFGARSAGDPYHEGTTFLRDVAWMAAEDDHVVSLLRRAGFVIVGRTNVPELASTATTEPDAYGPTHNPWDLERSPGGSSGGSAAAVAAGLVALAHGTDGGGSIRIPASACGLVGLKPSRGRVSWGPSLGESGGGLAANFALTRSVRDTAALLDLLAAPGLGDPYAAPEPARPFREIREPRTLPRRAADRGPRDQRWGTGRCPS